MQARGTPPEYTITNAKYLPSFAVFTEKRRNPHSPECEEATASRRWTPTPAKETNHKRAAWQVNASTHLRGLKGTWRIPITELASYLDMKDAA